MRLTPGCLLLVCLPWLAGCDHFQSFESVCEKRLGPASVEVVAEQLTYETDFTRSIEQLSAKGAASTGRIVLGMVETKLAGSVEFTAQGIVKPFSGRYCMRPAIKVHLAFRPTTLYVARQYREGSCEFDITMDHEKKHIRVYQAYLDELADEVEVELREQLGNRIQYFDSTDAGEVHLKERTAATLRPYMDRGMIESAKRQAAVDTPEEYFRLESFQSRCGPADAAAGLR